jgi:hypothetical protein
VAWEPGSCDTAAVKFYENFWVATAATAPVIALAAMLLLPEWTVRGSEATAAAVDAEMRAKGRGLQDWDHRYQRLAKMAWSVRTEGLVNVLLQAALLAVSLSALAYQRNVVRPWIAISIAAGGLLWLGWSSLQSGRFLEEWNRISRNRTR